MTKTKITFTLAEENPEEHYEYLTPGRKERVVEEIAEELLRCLEAGQDPGQYSYIELVVDNKGEKDYITFILKEFSDKPEEPKPDVYFSPNREGRC